MDPLALAKSLADLGGWAAFLTVVIAAGLGFIRGWVVPGRYWDREVANFQKAAEAAEQNRKAIADLTKVLEDRRVQREQEMDRLIALLERKRA